MGDTFPELDISGTVTGPDGKGMEGVKVYCIFDDHTVEEEGERTCAVTDGDGKFSFTTSVTPTYGKGVRRTMVFRKEGFKEASRNLHDVQIAGRQKKHKASYEIRMERK
jgi:hypothetical protein